MSLLNFGMADARYRTSCDACLSSKVKCSQNKPSCWRCTQHGQSCVYSQYRRIGRPPKRHSLGGPTPKSQQTHKSQQSKSRGNNINIQRKHASTPHPEPVSKILPAIRRDSAAPANSVANFEGAETLDTTDPHEMTWDFTDVWTHEDMAACVPSETSDAFGAIDNLDIRVYPTPVTTSLEPDDLSSTLDSTSTVKSSRDRRHHVTASPSPRVSDDHGRGTPPYLALISRPGCSSGTSSGYASISTSHSTEPRRQRRLLRPISNTAFLTTNRGASTSQHMTNEAPNKDTQYLFPSAYLPASPAPGPCLIQCHSRLSEQLNRLSDIRSAAITVSYDKLLALAEQTRQDRQKVLACQACFTHTRSCQTLLLLIMVIDALLALFEGDNPNCVLPVVDTVSFGSLDPAVEPDSPRSPPPLRQSFHLPLIVGRFEVEKSLQTSFLSHLLRRHFESQKLAVEEIHSRISSYQIMAVKGDLRYRVAAELLRDMSERIQELSGRVVFGI